MTKNKLPYGTGITFLSEPHIEIAEWLRENRHLPQTERMEEVAIILCKHSGTDAGLLLHYAASFFITLDNLEIHHKETLPAIMAENTVMQMQNFSKYLRDSKTQSGKNANQGRVEKFQAIWSELKNHWQDNLTHVKSASQTASKLQATAIYKNSETKPEKEVIARYVRKWKKEI